MKVLAERLKELRQEKNLTTFQLSKLIGCSDASISRWENEIRTPNAEVLVKFAKFYNVSTDYLCGLED
ncbi:MAG: helix-turn-helix domain-containing protein [Candidatus Caccovivens sp.]